MSTIFPRLLMSTSATPVPGSSSREPAIENRPHFAGDGAGLKAGGSRDNATSPEQDVHRVARMATTESSPPVQTEDQTLTREKEPRFAALRHPNFRLFWTGNLISLVGTLAQQTAQGWLVRSLTADPFLVTAIAACGSAPFLLLTLYAGVVAGRVGKRVSLMGAN